MLSPWKLQHFEPFHAPQDPWKLCTTFTALEPLHAMEMTACRALEYIACTKSLEFTSFRALAYTKFLDFTRNLSKLRVISHISFDLQSALPVRANLRHKLRMQTAESHDPFHKRSQNRYFRGRPVQGDSARKQQMCTYFIFEGRKISYGSANI